MTDIRHRPLARIAALSLAVVVAATACGGSQTEHSSSTDTLTTSHRVKDTAVVKTDVTVKTDTLQKTDNAKAATKQ
jgi:ABC-type glycerol-3-phosphate transport system substrate-binding protein